MVAQLPSTGGSGTPALVDYAVAVLPNGPDGYPFSVGCDPHSVTAYVSPMNGRALGVMAHYGSGVCYAGAIPQYLALIDLAWLLAAPRSGPNTVDPSIDLVGSGIVKFVQVQ